FGMLVVAIVDRPALLALELENVVVYRQSGRFGGWPANHGMWNWGNELLVGFSAGYFKDNGPDRHAIDHDKPEEHLLARSLDGGRTWSIENPAAQGALIPRGKALHGTELPGVVDRPWTDCPGGIDFAHPDFAMTLRMSDNNGGQSRFYYSTDRGHHWQGPFKFPMLGQSGISARTDYLVNGPSDCLVFLTASKSTGGEGRPLCARTTDGGKTWNFVSFIGPEPPGYSIMPSTVRVGSHGLLSAVRVRHGEHSWLETYFSPDDGRQWTLRGKPADTGEGNPAAMLCLGDGRICITYGVRSQPFGMRARLSGDDGRTWSEEIMLRSDGGGRDLGYPRSVERPDGKLVTVYYFNDDPRETRYIAATIWDPATAGSQAAAGKLSGGAP
ncbi:MAG TPA: sialidase family protein, partial [Pirellulales bacterium]|nr:sialidase family protein [Pirellulales bacterium]